MRLAVVLLQRHSGANMRVRHPTKSPGLFREPGRQSIMRSKRNAHSVHPPWLEKGWTTYIAAGVLASGFTNRLQLRHSAGLAPASTFTPWHPGPAGHRDGRCIGQVHAQTRLQYVHIGKVCGVSHDRGRAVIKL